MDDLDYDWLERCPHTYDTVFQWLDDGVRIRCDDCGITWFESYDD